MDDDEWWRGAVLYQIYPRSYQDSNGDGIGDLPGIIQRLPHVAALGADAVWLSPIFRSPMADMGYDVSDYIDIDPLFGTLADFDRLVASAHALGLKVMIDQVISHSSDRHPLFQQSRQSRDNPKADWYVWADPKPDGTPPNNWQSMFGGSAWTWDTRRRQYYLHNFLASQPDLNFHNPMVQDYVLDTMGFWLDRGVDGFRLDVVNFYFHDADLRDHPADDRPKSRPDIRPFDMQMSIYQKTRPENLAFLQRLRKLMDSYPDRATVGEIGELRTTIETMAAYTTQDRLNMGYSFELLGPEFTAAHVRRQVEAFFAAAPDGWPCWSFSNHDVIRHATRWSEHGRTPASLAKLTAAILLSLQGSVCLYQGEELGQLQTDLSFDELTDPQGIAFWPEDKGRDGCRTPMVWDGAKAHGGFSEAAPWLPVKDLQRAQSVTAQQDDPDAVMTFYRRMLALRRSSADLRRGRSLFLDLPEPILAFWRGQDTFCAFNLGQETVTVDAGVSLTAALAQDAVMTGGRVTLGPNGVLIGRRAP